VAEKSLRLSGGPNESTTQQVDDALLEVNIGFHDRLGASRVTALQAMTRSDTPSTEDQRTRARAEAVERNWLKLILMRSMQAFFLDGASQASQTWNEEGLLRDAGKRAESELVRLEGDVKEGLDFLAGIVEASNPHVTVIGPPKTNPAPGSFIYTATL
jgi:hypothetical protein